MALRRHLRILTGGIEERRMTPSIKAAFATSDRHRVDQHFGAASALLIYAVTAEQATVIEFAQFGDLDRDGHEDKLAAKLALLQGCAVVYCQAVGGSAIQQLLARGSNPSGWMPAPLSLLCSPLFRPLCAAAAAPAWLNRAIVRQRQTESADTRFVAMEAEGWQE